MTNSVLNPSEGLPVDTGPLSWVIGEIREALTRSKEAVHEALTLDAEVRSTALRHAKTHLHQAHGALQIVDIDGVALLTEAAENLFDKLEAGTVQLSAEVADAIVQAYQALLEYFEELLSRAGHQPVRLFPYYRTLLEVQGAERIHPSDLFYPNLANRPQLPAIVPPIDALDYPALRKRFERALLPFIKSAEPAAIAAQAAEMGKLVTEVEQAQGNQQSRVFWWVLRCFVEGVAAGEIKADRFVKQLFGLINLQIRRLSEGSPSIAERLLRDALFFIACAENPSPNLQQVRLAYQLDGLVPSDFESRRYGQIDASALAAAKDRLAQAKNAWNRVASGDAGAGAQFEAELHKLAEAGARLQSPPLLKFLSEIGGIAHHVSDGKFAEKLGLEMATSLLFVEYALNHIGRLPDNFAERADAMTARLLSVISGQAPTESVQWLDDMSREAQQRQTMQVLVNELQTSLRQVEKTLDEYFNNPAERAALTQIEATLHQIGGALAILDQEDAVLAVQHTQAAVKRFGESDGVPDVAEFQQVARNVGALSFFIETLQLQSDGAKKRFTFDSATGVFRANLVEPQGATGVEVDLTAASATAAAATASSAPAEADLTTVEDELVRHQQQSVELALSLTEEPDNPVLQERLKESLEQVRRDATLIDDADANDRAQAAIKMLGELHDAPTQEVLAEIASAAAPAAIGAAAAEAALPMSPAAPETDEEIDAELLEIFLTEAVEVLASVRETVPLSRNEPHNQDHLTTLRRSFHTLKGSGRMVGLMTFGEAAWGIEQVLNLRLSETRPGDADLYALLDKAADLLGAWVNDLQIAGKSSRTPHALVEAAERVKAGGAFSYDGPPEESFVAVQSAVTEPELVATPVLEPEPQQAALAEAEASAPVQAAEPMAEAVADLGVPDLEELSLSIPTLDEMQAEEHFAEMPAAQAGLPEIAEVIDFPTAAAPVAPDDSVKRIGDLEISVPLHNIYLAETDELVRLLSQDVSEWRHEPERLVNIQAVHAAHSLAGSSATVGFAPLHEVAHALELALQYLARRPAHLAAGEFDILEQAVERIRFMLQMFALGEMPDREQTQVDALERLPSVIEERLRLEQEMAAQREQAAAAEAGAPSRRDQSGQSEYFDLGQEDTAAAPVLDLAPAQHDASLPLEKMEIAHAAELPFAEPVLTTQSNVALDPALASLLKDELDPDLLPVFLEEGRDMLPQMGHELRSWQDNPGDAAPPQAILRLLHTLKGSARMAGAMGLGQHWHEMETRIEHLAHSGRAGGGDLDEIVGRYDHGLQMFEDLQNPQAAAARAAEMAQAPVVASQAVALEIMETPSAGAPIATGAVESAPVRAPLAPVAAAVGKPAAPLVRVRADLLDRMVNQAGEVSIARSRLETEVGALRQSLGEMTDNVARLRDQLREIEMQAETQITSRMGQSADREFDPLEFDRFTRLQELTRMMAESVADVSSVQQNLARTVDNASADLTSQGRLTRELQQDLMRVRMVQFASIAERLYRVTRQASKEVDKRVNLDIRGSAVEIDRSVLEKMAGPFEHLLRNAIVHGIEGREQRLASGKNEVGELLVEIRQEGNEVAIQFSDDGRGLNLAGIRDKARKVGLLAADEDVSDTEATDLIFHPGFSTAEQVTELAGRGVGMDVVRSEAAALGGRVSVVSEVGKGAHFTIRLPLTLAVTQVVILTTGGKTYAVPSVLVEQVLQLKAHPLASAYNDGAVSWQGQRVPLYYLSALLGDREAAPLTQQYSPILVLRSGGERVAIHVDEIVGNREVVVKNIGPQLSRMIGIAGATVLGSGDIVLILNPVPLAQRLTHEMGRAPRLSAGHGFDHAAGTAPADLRGDVLHEAVGAVAEMGGPALAEPVQGLRTHRIVMVVDDSLTVRRVTQRLLAREGYQVVLAKDGVDALEQLQAVTPDVMLVDIEMPRMDGFDLTRNVRDSERTRHIPIIMITSRTASKHRNYAMELGVNEYLGKPYQEETLLKSIAGYIESRAA
ncbi:MAG: Hpt domain-containing protein [Burkholderiaceae bacterium]|nr:Hpt domain-containing protein [Burkholderiaceae bacterium]